ncbi:PmoA family protein [Lentzea sp. NPDC051838]|uniref:DUF6807 domain-containing protein n=1 Tax=Lentzea sp. NPDC051838 TaxID=3154849 RepID=UPI003442B95A
MRYVRTEVDRPYLELETLQGRSITDVGPEDHPWHTGLSLAVAHVGEANFWGGPTFVRGEGYVQLPNNGTQQSDEFLKTGNGFSERLSWLTQPGEHVITEERRVDKTAHDNHYAITWRSRLTNVSAQPLVFGSPATNGRDGVGYGGILWRGPMEMVQGTVLGAQMGEESAWLAYVTEQATLVFETPQPTWWFVRTQEFPAVCPAPFFHEETTLTPGSSLTLVCRLTVADGAWDATQIRACRAGEGGGLFYGE